MHVRNTRRRQADGGPGRPSASFTVSAMAIVGIAALALSCGERAVELAPPPALVANTVTVNPGSTTSSALGETARFTAAVRNQNGQVMAGVAVVWASTDTSVAAVDDSGLVTAAANGTSTITRCRARPWGPRGVKAIGVEYLEDAKPLPDFIHPKPALNIFGPEDGTLRRSCWNIAAR